jgi:hypothetical protein
VAVALIAASVFAGSKYLPVRISAYEFRDFIEQECRTGSLRRGPAEVRKRIMDKAEDMEIPLDTKQLVVKKTHSQMIVRAKYVQPIDFKVYTYNYRFEHEYKAPLF